MFLSNWIMTKNQPKAEGPAASSGKLMQYLFPLMSVWFCLTYNASFACYWTVSSLFSVISTVLINKSIEKEQKAVVEVSRK